MTRVTFHTLGCRLNQCETAQMEESLARSGYDIVPWREPADVRVLNTCTVTGKTDRECRRLIRRAKRLHPDAAIVVTGCYAQVAPDDVAAIPGVDLVLGNVDKLSLADHLEAYLSAHPAARPAARPAAQPAAPTEERPAAHTITHTAGSSAGGIGKTAGDGEFITHFSGYTRAFLKVQNGCDSRCSYCIIPEARGPSRSMPLDDVVRQIDTLHDHGFREVVLTGIHIGTWGRDTNDGALHDLLHAILERTPLGRLRLSSTEPMEITDEVLSVAADAGRRFARHFHVPLQSGSDAVLRRMNRPYRSADYARRVGEIRRVLPTAAIGADVIVGFPGETDHEFAQTLELVRALPLTYLHVFAYSDRPGTPASTMEDKVHPETIRERSAELRSLGDQKRRAFEETLRGEELEALMLGTRTEDGRTVGLTGPYVEVAVADAEHLENRFVRVQLRDKRSDGRWEADITGGSHHEASGTAGTFAPPETAKSEAP